MPVNTGVGRASIGRDVSIVLIGPYGRIDIPNVTGFDCKQVTANIKIDRLDGQQIMAELPKGWTGSFQADRGSAAVELAFAAIEAGWFATGNIPVSTIYQYIVEPDGSTTTWQFDNVVLRLDDAGQWRGDNKVQQSISFEANKRRSV